MVLNKNDNEDGDGGLMLQVPPLYGFDGLGGTLLVGIDNIADLRMSAHEISQIGFYRSSTRCAIARRIDFDLGKHIQHTKCKCK